MFWHYFKFAVQVELTLSVCPQLKRPNAVNIALDKGPSGNILSANC